MIHACDNTGINTGICEDDDLTVSAVIRYRVKVAHDFGRLTAYRDVATLVAASGYSIHGLHNRS